MEHVYGLFNDSVSNLDCIASRFEVKFVSGVVKKEWILHNMLCATRVSCSNHVFIIPDFYQLHVVFQTNFLC